VNPRRNKRRLIIQSIIWNAIVIGLLIGGLTLIFNLPGGGGIPVGAVPFVVIAFYLAALLTTSFVYRGYLKRKLASREEKERDPSGTENDARGKRK